MNPENQVKEGNSLVLTCSVMVDGVKKKDIKWKKDGEEITKGVSKNKWVGFRIWNYVSPSTGTNGTIKMAPMSAYGDCHRHHCPLDVHVSLGADGDFNRQ